jgi:hypothetical protein
MNAGKGINYEKTFRDFSPFRGGSNARYPFSGCSGAESSHKHDIQKNVPHCQDRRWEGVSVQDSDFEPHKPL